MEQTIATDCMPQMEQTIATDCMPQMLEEFNKLDKLTVAFIKESIEKLNEIKLNSSHISISKNADILINEFEKILVENPEVIICTKSIMYKCYSIKIYYEIFTMCNDNNIIKKKIINSNDVLTELNKFKRTLQDVSLSITLNYLQIIMAFGKIDGYDYRVNQDLIKEYIFQIDKFINSDFMTKDDVVYMSYEKIMYDKLIDSDVNIMKRVKTVNGTVKFILFQSDDYVLLEKKIE